LFGGGGFLVVYNEETRAWVCRYWVWI